MSDPRSESGALVPLLVDGPRRGSESTHLSAELIDLLTEQVASPPDAAARARVIVELIECAVDAIRWRHGPRTDGVEELSGLDIVDTAVEHARRMQRSSLIA